MAAAEDVEGLSADELSSRLGIGAAPSFYLITFPVESIRGALASPVRRPDQCFVGGGRTRGGAREFVIRNQPIPPFATIEEVF